MRRFFKNGKSVLALLLAVTFLFFGTASSSSTGNTSSDNGASDDSEAAIIPDFPSLPLPFPGIMPLDDWDCHEFN